MGKVNSSLCLAVPITSLTAHRLLIAAATIAAKGLSDEMWEHKYYAYVGGVGTRELSRLEYELLLRLEWKIVPSYGILRFGTFICILHLPDSSI